MVRRILIAVLMALSLAACGAEPVWAPDEAVMNAAYVHDGPPMVTLVTVISNRSGAGAHSALLINGSERVIFDPAGTWHHPLLPERNDVHFGMTDPAMEFYIDYHARITYRVVRQDLVVSPETAEAVMRAAMAYGAVPKAFCANAVSHILRSVPGFETIPQTMYPKQVMKAFGALPGVTEETFYDDDPDRNGYLLEARI